MAENPAKIDFLNYLMQKKHGLKPTPPPVINNLIKRFTAPDHLLSFTTDMACGDLELWLERLESILPIESILTKDLLFAMLYSSGVFTKMIRNKNFRFCHVLQLYRAQFQENKKYIMEYNKRGKSTLGISTPQSICTRFPPEPSGYLHIGHAKAALLNQSYAKDGTLIIRMDDTNPEKESAVFEAAILEDLKLLNITDYKLTHSSDYFDRLYEYALQLIREGKAYADNTDRETMQKERTDGIPSKNRGLEPEASLKIFSEMKEGLNPEYCLRAKISTDDPNKALRDPVIYRSLAKPHPRTGSAYKIYPTYDFTVPIVDSLEGVTLTLRTNEYRDRNTLYTWFLDALRLENRPKLHDFSRLCFDNTVVSKRKMKYYVENNFVDGWDDPRLCTLRGLRRLGMHPDALIEYIRLQGASQKTAVNSWDKIWAMNKKTIDPISPRYTAILAENHVSCEVAGVGDETELEILLHRKNSELGRKNVLFSREILLSQEDACLLDEGEEFTLMNWGNAILRKKSMEGSVLKALVLELHLEGDFKQTKNKISWISKKGALQILINEYGSLQNSLDTEDLAEKFNKDSKKTSWWFAEPAIRDVNSGTFIQIERIGFFYCDSSYEFNLIPYTKQKRSQQN